MHAYCCFLLVTEQGDNCTSSFPHKIVVLKATHLLIILLTFSMLKYSTFLPDCLSLSLLITCHTYSTLTYTLSGSPWQKHGHVSSLNKDSAACFTTACASPAIGRFSFNEANRGSRSMLLSGPLDSLI